MAGNGDERRGSEGRSSGPQNGAAAVQAAWVESRLQNLRDMMDGVFDVVAAMPATADDISATDKKIRAITNLARAVAGVEAAARRMMAEANRDGDNTEDEMNDSDIPDPETAERYRAELLDRLDNHTAIVEAKRVARAARDRARLEGGEPGDAAAGGASGTGAGAMAHLGDAGWPGVREDLCGGPLAA